MLSRKFCVASMRHWIVFLIGYVWSDPDVSWISQPILHPFHECRATETSILVAWSLGDHASEEMSHYEVRVRWPMAMEQYDYRLQSRPTENDFFAINRVLNREYVKRWSDFFIGYTGRGRSWDFVVSDQLQNANGTVRVFDLQVRAVTVNGIKSDWSAPVLTHTVLPNEQERFLVELTGTGMNNAMASKIIVNGVSIFDRTDLRGLALAVFNRANFALEHIDVYDVFADVSESVRMTHDIVQHGPDKFIAVVSGDAWERNLGPQLASALETYGGYYVGQWARIFSSSIRSSEFADLSETASGDTFGHPYALWGMWGLGMGGGIESLQLNTGHYLVTGKSERAIVRLQVYYNYMLGRYFVSRSEARTADFFKKAQRPVSGTLHNPATKVVKFDYTIQRLSLYAPYIGNLHRSIEYLMEANETVVRDEFNATNYGFEIVQNLEHLPDPLITVDPRADMQTELERVWGGPTRRFSGYKAGEALPGTVETTTPRKCADLLALRFSNDLGSICPNVVDSGNVDLLKFGKGLFPTICRETNCRSKSILEDLNVIDPSSPWTAASVDPRIWLD